MEGPAFVKWIETMLIQNDISKETFYLESGISTANMAQWRSGEYNPSKKSILKAERFFDGRQKEKSPTPEGMELDKETIELREIWNSADQEEREAILAMAKMLKARRNK